MTTLLGESPAALQIPQQAVGRHLWLGNERLSLPKKSAIGVALTRNSELRGCRLNLEQHSRIKTSLVGLCLLITAPSLSFSPGYAGALDTELVLRSNNATPEANQNFARLQKETLDLFNGYRYNESKQKFLEMLRLLSQVYGSRATLYPRPRKIWQCSTPRCTNTRKQRAC